MAATCGRFFLSIKQASKDDHWLALFVLLSRAETLDNILIYRLGKRTHFDGGPPKFILKELDRLRTTEVATLQRLDKSLLALDCEFLRSTVTQPLLRACASSSPGAASPATSAAAPAGAATSSSLPPPARRRRWTPPLSSAAPSDSPAATAVEHPVPASSASAPPPPAPRDGAQPANPAAPRADEVLS